MKIEVAISPRWAIYQKTLIEEEYNWRREATYLKKVDYYTGVEPYGSLEELIQGTKEAGELWIGEPFEYKMVRHSGKYFRSNYITGEPTDIAGIKKDIKKAAHRGTPLIILLEGTRDQTNRVEIRIGGTSSATSGRAFVALGGNPSHRWSRPALLKRTLIGMSNVGPRQREKDESGSFRIVRKK